MCESEVEEMKKYQEVEVKYELFKPPTFKMFSSK